MSQIYILVREAYYKQFEGKQEYIPADYEEEGFIHCTKGDDLLLKVVNRVYKDEEGKVLLMVVDEQKVTTEIKYEQAKDGMLYPHIYGSLNMDAVVAIKEMRRESNGWDLPK